MTERPPVMIVEDDLDSRVMLATVLSLHGYAVVTAKNGAEALTLVRRQKPCLILLDLMMPVMTGEQFRVEQLRDPEVSDVPVILVTAVGREADSKAAALGAHCCIHKPLDLDEVTRQVERFCGDSAHGNGGPE